LQIINPKVYGAVLTLGNLPADPVPFLGDRESLSLQKDLAVTSAPAGTIRDIILQHMAGNAHASARTEMANYLQSGAGQSASVHELAFVHRTIQEIGAQALLPNLLTVCLNRQDLRSKLLAADILHHERDHVGALSVLNSYSFVGSDTLMRDALLRKALLYPLVGAGGYKQGLKVLDTLRVLAGADSMLFAFIDLYPKLLSGLTHSPAALFPKYTQQALPTSILPTSIDVWPNYPNPFSDVTSFTFKLGEDKHVRLAIYDAMGREVSVITDADYHRGVHSAVLRSGDLPSGLYFYRLTTDEGVIQRKMLLMR
jgi:hypothetical protein